MELLEHWRKIWKNLNARPPADEVFYELLRRYSEPHRAYHTLDHVRDCLNELNWASGLADKPDEIRMAIWFHDAVYNPFASDNEERSARLAEKSLAEAGISDSAVRRISDMILTTKHPCRPESPDARLLMDIDLSILGKPRDIFDDYVLNINGFPGSSTEKSGQGF